MREVEGYVDLLCCPRCAGQLALADDGLRCARCPQRYEVADGIPRLFWPNEWDEARPDVTEVVKEFYEATPFPNYDDFDTADSLAMKAREGRFARLLDEQLPRKARIIECGSGTSQLSNFLSIANREVFATDMCLNSLRLGQRFARAQRLDTVSFVQMNLFRPVFKAESFHVVISNGVLHHTSDPLGGFRSIARLVRRGGFILVGLYHRYGRLVTDARRVLFRLSGDRLQWLDPNLRRERSGDAKKGAWFADQYKHPHESKHTIGEAIRWLEQAGFTFVRSVPRSRPFVEFRDDEQLFSAEEPGSALERFMVELGMIGSGSREGGFFVVIGRKR